MLGFMTNLVCCGDKTLARCIHEPIASIHISYSFIYLFIHVKLFILSTILFHIYSNKNVISNLFGDREPYGCCGEPIPLAQA